MFPAKSELLTLRGFAILLVVSLHTMYNPDVHVEDGTIWAYLCSSLAFLRMPLFTVMSGLLYGARPLREGQAGPFWKGKCRRILLPFMCAAIPLYILLSFTATQVTYPLSEIWTVFVLPFDIYWFLQALVVVLAIVTILEVTGVMRRDWPRRIALVIATITAISLGDVFETQSWLKWMNVGRGLYLLPFFLWGIELTKLKGDRWFVGIASVVLVVSVAMQQRTLLTGGEIVRTEPLAIVGGLAVTGLLIRFPFRLKPLAYIGAFSYTVYLYHFIIVRILSKIWDPAQLASDRLGWYFLTMTVLSVAGSIVIHLIVSRIPVLCTAMLGLKSPRSKTPKGSQPTPSSEASGPMVGAEGR